MSVARRCPGASCKSTSVHPSHASLVTWQTMRLVYKAIATRRRIASCSLPNAASRTIQLELTVIVSPQSRSLQSWPQQLSFTSIGLHSHLGSPANHSAVSTSSSFFSSTRVESTFISSSAFLSSPASCNFISLSHHLLCTIALDHPYFHRCTLRARPRANSAFINLVSPVSLTSDRLVSLLLCLKTQRQPRAHRRRPTPQRSRGLGEGLVEKPDRPATRQCLASQDAGKRSMLAAADRPGRGLRCVPSTLRSRPSGSRSSNSSCVSSRQAKRHAKPSCEQQR